MLADYPNPDGWRLYAGDAFDGGILDRELREARVVLSNPPYEAFSQEEQRRYSDLRTSHKFAELAWHVLEAKPDMIGLIMPQVFLGGSKYRKLRAAFVETYPSIRLLKLPDRIFQHSEADTVLVTALRSPDIATAGITLGQVHRRDLQDFYMSHQPSWEGPLTFDAFIKGNQEGVLQDLWTYLETLPSLGDFAQIHRGIEFNLPLETHFSELISEETRPGFKPGLQNAEESLEPYFIKNVRFLNLSPQVQRRNAYKLPWHQPKVVVNTHRRSRGLWKLTAAPDYTGLVCYRNFNAIWLNNATLLPEVLSAILNSPLASAFVSAHDAQRDIRKETLEALPIPQLSPEHTRRITSLVAQYQSLRKDAPEPGINTPRFDAEALDIFKEIDAEVLDAYDISPKLERQLLDLFSNERRPVPFTFQGYFPEEFKPYISWKAFSSGQMERAGAKRTVSRLRFINDPVISRALSDLD